MNAHKDFCTNGECSSCHPQLYADKEAKRRATVAHTCRDLTVPELQWEIKIEDNR